MPKTILLAILSILLVGSIIIQPDASFQASLQGLTVWWNIVFPGMLPFLVLYEIMLAFGLAHAIGALLQPAMRRVTGLPGEAALALVIGWLGGFPAGSEAVASLRKRELLSRAQGQRLLAFAHMPNPLFMLVVIGAGFLHKPIAGMMITAAVWASALWLLLIALLFRRRKQNETSADAPSEDGDRSVASAGLLSAFAQSLQAGREQDGRSFGKVLGDAVAGSVQKLMVVGGFMIFASMLARLSEPLLSPITEQGFAFLGPALFESHLGAYAAAIWQAPGGSAAFACAIIAAVLAWSGFAGILQTGYAITGTDLKLLPFIAHRLNHSLHAFLLTLLLWKPLSWLAAKLVTNGAFPAMLQGNPADYGAGGGIAVSDLPALWPMSLSAAGVLLLLALLVRFALGTGRLPGGKFR
ncbi:nucleoside recognition domain-containing protein [Paenibacillus soyae]|uniref:Nucleoside recognition domain-containing protein n=1 Tax=Paenibacillus soyae TaxID=2969249 RepID=A0A9X2SBJ4_9BACL|nr:nucleoside recognition domain-containing protein [Paenibacillus soyae]MCR2804967.1 nucleoside recognition domain-containing protein [Paenibacillus soyae]